MLKELTHVSLDASFLLHRHAFILQMSHYGYSRYGELNTTVAYSAKFGGKVAVGLRFYYYYHHVDHYEAQHSVSFDVSLYARLSRKLSACIEVFNPARLRYGIKGGAIIPMHFTAVFLFQFDDRLLFSMKVHKQLPGLFDVSAGTCYCPTDYCYLSMDLSLRQAEVGLMLRYRHLYFTVEIQYNYNLGLAPEVGIQYQLPRKLKTEN